MAYYFHRSILLTRFITHQVMFSQPQKFAIRNSNPTVIIGKLVVVSIISLILVDFFYAEYQNWYNEHLLNKTVEKDTQFKIDILDDEFIPQPLIIDRLKKIFQPNRNQSYYHVIYGEYGTGKTTLTKQAIGQGVIYVEIPADAENIDDFGIVFGKSLNFAFEKHISFTAQLIKKILGDTNKAFKRTGAVYKRKHNKPPVIVYDNIAKLINVNSKVFDTLQNDAKMNANDRKYIAVFINSEDLVSKRMESRSSSWSRVDKPVMEISDFSKEESMKYLVEKRKINKKEAKKLYELVGGRIVELKSVADKFLAEQTFEVIEQQILTEVKKKFNSAKLLQNQIYHEYGKDVIHTLLNFKEIDINLFKKYFKDESVNEVLKANVFAYHPSRDTVTFQSQSVMYFIQKNFSIFTK
ncbi:unnamed protein product [Rhizophagus irregularis]|nr:unnamed protein product [Rhizophagus irregularis]